MPDSNNDIVEAQPLRYRLAATGFADVRRCILIRIAVTTPFLLLAFWYLDWRVEPHRTLFDCLFLPVILITVGYQLLKRERSKWQSLEIELGHDKLLRVLPGYPDLEIAPAAVTTVLESASGITIRTSSRLKVLFVSRHLLNYNDFYTRLKKFAPNATFVPARRSIRSLVVQIATVSGCMLIFGSPLYLMYTPHRELVLPLGIASFIAFAAMILYSLRSPDTPTSLRYTAWILLALPVLAILERLLWA